MININYKEKFDKYYEIIRNELRFSRDLSIENKLGREKIDDHNMLRIGDKGEYSNVIDKTKKFIIDSIINLLSKLNIKYSCGLEPINVDNVESFGSRIIFGLNDKKIKF